MNYNESLEATIAAAGVEDTNFVESVKSTCLEMVLGLSLFFSAYGVIPFLVFNEGVLWIVYAIYRGIESKAFQNLPNYKEWYHASNVPKLYPKTPTITLICYSAVHLIAMVCSYANLHRVVVSNASTLEQCNSALQSFVSSFNGLAGAVTFFVVYTGICAVNQIIKCYRYEAPEPEKHNQ